eukprot:Gregarina_sp_Pseudo_9__2866@NODE_3092_length_755_cov_39_474860_g2819_i0_p1_GENE_NODE_3092_length_755_cov_39_474860_g2819_i0NODE_3092_length_755_cov_39_474860_g2819_i0_p1_ORF_typecomplete_len245_score60_90zfRING_11/PF17123_5/2_8e05zfRING_11/PF17123_5/2_7e02zfRING_5/PF14634_6/1e04zfRING_5/PF14634_6/8_5e06zfC3HC4/PF00097_25/3e03zfC3HC4/PF00097_25/1_1e03zfC3HC4/PF00097_25/0_00043zfRING_2/PF13639_6/1_4e03zfRING_2/PF13639_6/0_00057zfRING_UBOX/PF13445_6/1_2e04zfRING_UBOX/PF13445_6/0_0026zfC3HC4_2/PF139
MAKSEKARDCLDLELDDFADTVAEFLKQANSSIHVTKCGLCGADGLDVDHVCVLDKDCSACSLCARQIILPVLNGETSFPPEYHGIPLEFGHAVRMSLERQELKKFCHLGGDYLRNLLRCNDPKKGDGCSVCLRPLHPNHPLITLTCGHVWCSLCLEVMVEYTLYDEEQFPPTCCDSVVDLDVMEAANIDASVIKEFKVRERELHSDKQPSRMMRTLMYGFANP